MKKLLAVLLTAAMTLSMLVVPVTVSAEATTATTETVGYQDVTGTKVTGTTDWANLTDFETNETYYIKDATGMTKLAELVNGGKATGKNITVYVTVETLDMSGVTSFAGIGTATNPFDGTFDGQGVTIQNLALDLTASQDYGLFGVINGGIVKNIVLDSTCTVQVTRRSSTLGDGALAGRINETGVVDNVMVKTAFKFNTNEEAAGGIVGIVAAASTDDAVQIRNCTFSGSFNKNGKNINQSGCVLGIASSGKVTLYNCLNESALDCGYGYDIGGIIGLASNGSNVTIDKCVNEGDITAKYKVGGIAGEACDVVITNSDNFAVVKAIDGDSSTSHCGGIIGIVKGTSYISNTNNSGAITSVKYNNAGGVVGYIDSGSLTLSGCENTGAVTAKTINAGGMVGYANGKLTLDGCINNGAVKATTNSAGGIVGFVTAASGTLTIENSTNKGTVFGGQKAGGMVGLAHSSQGTTIKNCVNDGSVSGQGALGGMIGDNEWNTTGEIIISNCVNFGAISGTNTETGTAWSCVGGIYGRMNADKLTISNCTNYGTLTHNGAYIGSIVGSVNTGNVATGVTITACSQKGTLNGSAVQQTIFCGNATDAAAKLTVTDCHDANVEFTATRFEGYQIGTYTEEGVTGNKIRLVGTIGSDFANYDEVGFIVKITRESDGEVKTVEHYCEAIYSSLLAENNDTVAASKYRQGGYMFALALYGISAGEYTFEVQTISLAMNGESYTVGETSTFDCTIPVPAA